MRASNRLLLALLALSPAACMVGPDYVAPHATTPASYANAVPTTQTAAADAAVGSTARPSVVSDQTEPATEWWTTLNDPTLNKLIRRAVAGNLGVRQAASRVRESRDELRMAGANELPQLNATGTFARIDTGKNGGFGGIAGGSSSSGNGTTTTAKRTASGFDTNIWAAGLDASWELDVFGGQRRGIEAASADYQAAIEDGRTVLISLAAEVARDYLELRGTQERLRIARDNLQLQQDTLQLTQALRKAGFNSELDVSRAHTQVSQTRAQIVPLTTWASQMEHAIAALLGCEPNALAGELDAPAPLPAIPSMAAIGMPSDLLRRRPDVRARERQLAAANARVGEAVADYFPKFSLTGDFGFDSTKFAHLFDWESRYLIVYPTVSWKLLDFGRTAAEVSQEKERCQQAALGYHDTVLTALREVEDALVAYANEQDRRAALASAVASARDAVDISRDQYKQGVIDFLQVLDAQRQLLAAQDELAQSDQAIATNLVALYKALGGGWENAVVCNDAGHAGAAPSPDEASLANH